MSRAWPMAAAVAWMAASVGAAALATGGPMLRPGVSLSPMTCMLAMAVALAIGWPLLTSSPSILMLVAGQGAVVLTIVHVAAERPMASLTIPLMAWIIVASLFYGARRLVARQRWGEGTAWTALLMATALLATLFLGGSWFRLPLFDTAR